MIGPMTRSTFGQRGKSPEALLAEARFETALLEVRERREARFSTAAKLRFIVALVGLIAVGEVLVRQLMGLAAG